MYIIFEKKVKLFINQMKREKENKKEKKKQSACFHFFLNQLFVFISM